MPRYVYLENNGVNATLTTWIYCAMQMMWAAEHQELVGYINWPNLPDRSLVAYRDDAAFAAQPNMYDWYFEQPMVQVPPPRDEVWTYQTCVQVGANNLMCQSAADIRSYVRQRVRCNAEVCTRGERLAARYQVDFSKTLGVTWRGTDSIMDGRPRMPIETYFPFIDDYLAVEPDLRIACTAEEEGILDALLQRYPQAFKVAEFFAAPIGCLDFPERFVPLSGYERGMQPALMVWFFSRCAYLIKNRSSCSTIANWLSTGQRVACLAHPENLGHGFDITKAEVDGKIVPLNR